MAIQVAPLGLRLFLEGVEVPIISAQVNIQPGQAAAAALQVIPTDSAQLLLPRTLVHVFYLDNEFLDPTNVSNLTTTSRDAAGMPQRLQDDQNRFLVADEQYKLLFSGEVIGYNYSKDPSSRSLVLQCLDFSSYWDTCYQWFAEFAVGGSGFTDKHHNVIGAGAYLFNDVAAGTKWLIGNILNSRPENPLYRDVTGLLAGYIHLLEVIGGLRPKKGASYKAFRGVNDFFTIAELMYNLTGMLGAIQSDKTSAKMFAAGAFRDWLRNGMASAGSLISFRDVLGLVGRYIFHDSYPNPAAKYLPPSSTLITRRESTSLDLVGDEAVGKISDAIDKILGVEVVFTSSANPIVSTVAETRGVLIDAEILLLSALEDISASGGTDRAKLGAFIRVADSHIMYVIRGIAQGFGVGLAGGRFAAGFENKVEISQQTAQIFKVQLGKANENLWRVLAGRSVRRTHRTQSEETVGSHLFNQLLLPETFFVVPPRCNVLFPDMYFSFSYSRNFMKEISRLACQGGIEMVAQGQHSGILGTHYFAPNIKAANGEMAIRSVFSQGTVLLPHEVHSGILPKFEWVTDGHRWGIHAAKGRGELTKGKKIAYIQRLANFQFFMHRWSARRMNVQARFNPHMVIGFPGVVLDRSSPSVAVLAAATKYLGTTQALLPTAYVGKVATLQHMVNQNSGTTTVGYTHCRTHRGIDDDFLGILEREIKESTTDTINVVPEQLLQRALSHASETPEEATVNVQKWRLLKLWIKGGLVLNTDLPIGTVGDIRGVNLTEVPLDPSIEVGSNELQLLGVSLDDYFSLRTRQAGIRSTLDDPDDGVLLPEIMEVDIETRTQEGKIISRGGSLPFEEMIRPGWYSKDVWNNESISAAVYLPLLGTTAITDDKQVGDPDQFRDLMKASIEDVGNFENDVSVEQDGPELVLKIDGEVAATIGFNLETGSTTESAIDGLMALYGLLKRRDLDVQSFIDDYVKRPIANLVEILGDSDFQLGDDGEPKKRKDGTEPFEGFHSRAFGPYNVDVKHRAGTATGTSPPKAGKQGLHGLLPTDQKEKDKFNKTGTIITKGKKDVTIAVPAFLDPRGRAQARVSVYAAELTYTRGILAV